MTRAHFECRRYTSRMSSTLLCLHGWGGSSASYQELRDALKNDPITVFAPDLPGFGSEPDPERPWTVDDYADWVTEYLKKQNVAGPILLLGHSHGGRISLKLAARKTVPIRHMYLCAAAGMRRRRYVKRVLGLVLSKIGHVLFLIPGVKSLEPKARKLLARFVGSYDYEKASDLMKKTLVLVTKENLEPLLASVDVPTDIFWGEDDRQTPVADAYILRDGIKGSDLHVFPGVRHRVHRDKAREIAGVIREQLNHQ